NARLKQDEIFEIIVSKYKEIIVVMQAKIAFLRDLSVNSPEKPLHVLLTRICLLDERKKA
ncbi:hypothetical protein AAULR_13127, partial [Lacticaseibacillus rhamnosus MTCC 5462]